MKVLKSPSVSLRVNPANKDHHLFNNNGTWWVHYTVFPDALTSERKRCSLGTANVECARRRRDLLFEVLFSGERRSQLEVYFYPTLAQTRKIENKALEFLETSKAALVDRYNQIARTGLFNDVNQWVELVALRLTLRHHFGDPVIGYEANFLKVNCLIDVDANGALKRFVFP